VQPRDLWTFVRTASHDTADYKVNKAVPLLFGLMAVSLVATLLILVLPRWCWARGCRGSAACSGFYFTSCSSAPATS